MWHIFNTNSKISFSKRARLEREREEKQKRAQQMEFTQQDLALATVPGLEFDPRKRSFAPDELRPQPIIRKRKKVMYYYSICFIVAEHDRSSSHVLLRITVFCAVGGKRRQILGEEREKQRRSSPQPRSQEAEGEPNCSSNSFFGEGKCWS